MMHNSPYPIQLSKSFQYTSKIIMLIETYYLLVQTTKEIQSFDSIKKQLSTSIFYSFTFLFFYTAEIILFFVCHF